MGSIDNRLENDIRNNNNKTTRENKNKPICFGRSSCLAGNVLSNGT